MSEKKKRLTKRQREQVVELLRCAADLAIISYPGSALGVASFETGTLMPGSPMSQLDYWYSLLGVGGLVVNNYEQGWYVADKGYEFCLLDAALRIEQGEAL